MLLSPTSHLVVLPATEKASKAQCLPGNDDIYPYLTPGGRQTG